MAQQRDEKMNFLDAAFIVLTKAKEPLNVRSIVDEAVRLGLIEPAGKTPMASMQGLLRRQEESESPRFKRVFGKKAGQKGNVRWTLINKN
jgi:hypothetical protein